METKDYQIRVCVGNWGYYAEGELRDQWVSLPMTDADLAAWLRDNGLVDPMHEETYISDYDGMPLGLRYGGVLNKYTSLHDVNALAKAMDYASAWELEAAEAAIETGAAEPKDMSELINLVIQADEVAYTKLPRYGTFVTTEKRLGCYYAEETGLLAELEKIGADAYFDFELYGQDVAADVFLADDGYVSDVPALDYYDADEIRETSSNWDADHAMDVSPDR